MIDEYFLLLKSELELNSYKCDLRVNYNSYQLSVYKTVKSGHVTYYTGNNYFACINGLGNIIVSFDEFDCVKKAFNFFKLSWV